MIGLFLSGTGNTKHCIELLLHLLDDSASAVPMESEEAVKLASEQETIILAYPTQYSNIPFMVHDFIRKNAEMWSGKKIFCLTTMGLFSGDGTGCAARLLKKYGAYITGGLQIKMPDSICDNKLLKKSKEENLAMIKAADRRIAEAAEQMKNGVFPQEGLGIVDHIAGLLGQRLWFYHKTRQFSSALKISHACTGCGLCAKVCPMHNITMDSGKPIAEERCTMCYRCISLCPKQAITLLGKKVVAQYRFEDYEQ